MSVRFERHTRMLCIPYHSDLGYLYCAECGPTVPSTPKEPYKPYGYMTGEKCDKCGRVVEEVLVPVPCQGVIEYTPCKIF